MKKIFIIQTFDLRHGSMSVSPVCFSSEEEALKYVHNSMRIKCRNQNLTWEQVRRLYTYNVLSLDFLI